MDSMGACAITGASGYVGSILLEAISKQMPVLRMVRNASLPNDIQWSFQTSSSDTEQMLRASRVKTLVHAAWDMRATTYSELHRSCVQGSNALFEAAARAGVERIVFISTISAFEGCRSAYGKTKLAVEKRLADTNAVVLRPGLVFGSSHSGGVFGSIRKQVMGGRILPLIGSGTVPQYLLHAQTLGQCTANAVLGKLGHLQGAPVTLAHPTAWPFRDLVRNIALSEGRDIKLAPVPWQLLYCGFRLGELMRLNLPFRSDSVISFIYSNRNPDFRPMQALGIEPIPYTPHAAAIARRPD